MAQLGLVVIVVLAVLLSAFAVIRPVGEPPVSGLTGNPTETIRISTFQDLAGISMDDLRKVAEGEAAIDIDKLTMDAGVHLDEVSQGVRALDQNYQVPAVRGATSSTGSSVRRP